MMLFRQLQKLPVNLNYKYIQALSKNYSKFSSIVRDDQNCTEQDRQYIGPYRKQCVHHCSPSKLNSSHLTRTHYSTHPTCCLNYSQNRQKATYAKIKRESKIMKNYKGNTRDRLGLKAKSERSFRGATSIDNINKKNDNHIELNKEDSNGVLISALADSDKQQTSGKRSSRTSITLGKSRSNRSFRRKCSNGHLVNKFIPFMKVGKNKSYQQGRHFSTEDTQAYKEKQKTPSKRKKENASTRYEMHREYFTIPGSTVRRLFPEKTPKFVMANKSNSGMPVATAQPTPTEKSSKSKWEHTISEFMRKLSLSDKTSIKNMFKDILSKKFSDMTPFGYTTPNKSDTHFTPDIQHEDFKERTIRYAEPSVKRQERRDIEFETMQVRNSIDSYGEASKVLDSIPFTLNNLKFNGLGYPSPSLTSLSLYSRTGFRKYDRRSLKFIRPDADLKITSLTKEDLKNRIFQYAVPESVNDNKLLKEKHTSSNDDTKYSAEELESRSLETLLLENTNRKEGFGYISEDKYKDTRDDILLHLAKQSQLKATALVVRELVNTIQTYRVPSASTSYNTSTQSQVISKESSLVKVNKEKSQFTYNTVPMTQGLDTLVTSPMTTLKKPQTDLTAELAEPSVRLDESIVSEDPTQKSNVPAVVNSNNLIANTEEVVSNITQPKPSPDDKKLGLVTIKLTQHLGVSSWIQQQLDAYLDEQISKITNSVEDNQPQTNVPTNESVSESMKHKLDYKLQLLLDGISQCKLEDTAQYNFKNNSEEYRNEYYKSIIDSVWQRKQPNNIDKKFNDELIHKFDRNLQSIIDEILQHKLDGYSQENVESTTTKNIDSNLTKVIDGISEHKLDGHIQEPINLQSGLNVLQNLQKTFNDDLQQKVKSLIQCKLSQENEYSDIQKTCDSILQQETSSETIAKNLHGDVVIRKYDLREKKITEEIIPILPFKIDSLHNYLTSKLIPETFCVEYLRNQLRSRMFVDFITNTFRMYKFPEGAMSYLQLKKGGKSKTIGPKCGSTKKSDKSTEPKAKKKQVEIPKPICGSSRKEGGDGCGGNRQFSTYCRTLFGCKKDPCAPKKKDPCAKKENPCAPKKKDPCAPKKKDPCAPKKKDPCVTKKKDPCAKKDPCPKKDPCKKDKPCKPCKKCSPKSPAVMKCRKNGLLKYNPYKPNKVYKLYFSTCTAADQKDSSNKLCSKSKPKVKGPCKLSTGKKIGPKQIAQKNQNALNQLRRGHKSERSEIKSCHPSPPRLEDQKTPKPTPSSRKSKLDLKPPCSRPNRLGKKKTTKATFRCAKKGIRKNKDLKCKKPIVPRWSNIAGPSKSTKSKKKSRTRSQIPAPVCSKSNFGSGSTRNQQRNTLTLSEVKKVPLEAKKKDSCGSKKKDPCAPKKKDPCAPKKKDPCASKKKDPCAPKKKDPCAPKKKDPCASKKKDPCAPKKKDPCAPKKKDPCAPKKKDPCAPKKKDPCAPKKKDPCASKKKDPCASKKKDPCASKKKDPCAKKKNPCPKKKDPCATKKKDPCASKKKDPCAKKSPAPKCPDAKKKKPEKPKVDNPCKKIKKNEPFCPSCGKKEKDTPDNPRWKSKINPCHKKKKKNCSDYKSMKIVKVLRKNPHEKVVIGPRMEKDAFNKICRLSPTKVTRPKVQHHKEPCNPQALCAAAPPIKMSDEDRNRIMAIMKLKQQNAIKAIKSLPNLPPPSKKKTPHFLQIRDEMQRKACREAPECATKKGTKLESQISESYCAKNLEKRSSCEEKKAP